MAATVTLDKAYFETLLRRYAISLYPYLRRPLPETPAPFSFPVADVNPIELNLSVLTETNTACSMLEGCLWLV